MNKYGILPAVDVNLPFRFPNAVVTLVINDHLPVVADADVDGSRAPFHLPGLNTNGQLVLSLTQIQVVGLANFTFGSQRPARIVLCHIILVCVVPRVFIWLKRILRC